MKVLVYISFFIYLYALIKLIIKFKSKVDKIDYNNIPENIEKRRNIRLQLMGIFMIYSTVYLAIFLFFIFFKDLY